MKGHDKLQADCFVWCWNTHPETRQLLFTTRNNLTTQEEAKKAVAKMAMMKTMGMVKGTTDLVFYWGGRMYGFDIKIGRDKLSKEQLSFIAQLKKQGGDGCEIRSFEIFQKHIENILENGELWDEKRK